MEMHTRRLLHVSVVLTTWSREVPENIVESIPKFLKEEMLLQIQQTYQITIFKKGIKSSCNICIRSCYIIDIIGISHP